MGLTLRHHSCWGAQIHGALRGLVALHLCMPATEATMALSFGPRIVREPGGFPLLNAMKLITVLKEQRGLDFLFP